MKDLADTSRQIEISVREYEQKYGERFMVNNNATAGASGGGSRQMQGSSRRAASPPGRQGDSGAGLVNNVFQTLSTPVQRPTGRSGSGSTQNRTGAPFH